TKPFSFSPKLFTHFTFHHRSSPPRRFINTETLFIFTETLCSETLLNEAEELKPLLEEMESRSSRKEYGQILVKCHKILITPLFASSKDVLSLSPLMDPL
ncbi:hypothetical protein RYX36_030919, partial [Vicia faba]